MKKLADQIERLEQSFFDAFTWESTLIDPSCLTMAEKKLFSHIFQMTPLELTPDDVELSNKFSFYVVRRVFDLFMRAMNSQLREFDERFIFWSRFIDFISETMLIINRKRGSDFVLKNRFGEDVNNWPQDDDPAWKDFSDWEEKWEREFTKFWNQSSITAEKLFFQNRDVPPKDEGGSKEEAKTKMTKMFGEIISYCLTRPSNIDMLMLATLASEDPEVLDKLLKETKQ